METKEGSHMHEHFCSIEGWRSHDIKGFEGVSDKEASLLLKDTFSPGRLPGHCALFYYQHESLA